MSQDDLSDFGQATAGNLIALREDFVDLRQDFSDFQDDVGRGFAEMRGRLDATAAGQQRIFDLIESLIDQENR